jgi:hypothetical protein
MAAPMTKRLALIAIASCVLVAGCSKGGPTTKGFTTPDAAMRALVAAIENRNQSEVEAIVGKEMVASVNLDNVDREGLLKHFVRAARERIRIEADPDQPEQQIAYIGIAEWPFPAPLVRKGKDWHFDGAAGAKEIVYRRIGRNELATIGACMGYTDAQREYASEDRNGDGVLEYATRVNSTPGLRDGLYWSTDNGQALSPVGPFAAAAVFGEEVPGGKPEAQNGYWAKLIVPADNKAPATGPMPLMVAWPDKYGDTGVKTFVVDGQGEIFEKDLGADTANLAKQMSGFTSDQSWSTAHTD